MNNALESLVYTQSICFQGEITLRLAVGPEGGGEQEKEIIEIACERLEGFQGQPKKWTVVPDQEWNTLFLKQFSRIRIPLSRHIELGLDGSTSKVEIKAGGYEATLIWWLGLPEGFEELDLLLRTLLDKVGMGHKASV